MRGPAGKSRRLRRQIYAVFLQALYFPAWYFVLYSFLGWCLEVCFCTVVTGKWVNRGFLNGPVCPIYGFGMLVITAVLGPLQQNLLLLFVGGMVLTSTLELITGFVLKQLFHTRWWDYSDQKFQLGGYICLKFSLAWGLVGTLAVRLLHPAVRRLVEALPRQAGIPLLVIILLVFVADTIVTVNTIARLNRDLGRWPGSWRSCIRPATGSPKIWEKTPSAPRKSSTRAGRPWPSGGRSCPIRLWRAAPS